VDEQDLSWISLQSPDSAVVGHFQCPLASLRAIHDGKPVNCLNVSPHGELGVSGGNDGSLKVWETGTGAVRRDLKGHVGDILVCKFFPSSQVVLSGGSDVQLKIWSALDGTCAATIRGHSGGILDVDMVDRGRNIVSCSRDGTVRMWECGSQSQVAQLAQLGKPVNSVCVCTNPAPAEATSQPDSREYGTEGRMILLASDDASVRGIDLRNRKEIFCATNPTPMSRVTCIKEFTIAAGSQDGIVSVWDWRETSRPLHRFRRTTAEITSLDYFGGDQLSVATADGLFFLWDLRNASAGRDFTGPDYEPITSTSISSGNAFSSSRDGFIRKYKVPQQST
jgi:proteasomal ATPase-associated factor 1